MRCGRALLMSLCALAGAWCTLGAQRISGVVRDSATRVPLNSAIVSLLGAGDRVLDRALTNNQGAFSIAVPSGTATIQVRRIGYRPVTSPLPAAARNGTATIDLTMPRLPTVLPTMVSTDRRCPRSTLADQGTAAWEDARTGFLATVVARNMQPTSVRMYRYLRRGDEQDISVTRLDAPNFGTFRTNRTPADLAALGYAEAHDGTIVFSGPVADALLDDSFRDTHCFSLGVSDAAHRGQLGIRFTPTPGRDSVIDISGVVWMNQAPPALRSVEFHYEGLGQRAARTGGVIEFRAADNGAVVIDSWALRLNEGITARGPSSVGGAVKPAQIFSAGVNPLRVSEEGGELREATWSDGTRIDRALASVEGRAVDPDGKPLAGIRVVVPNTPYAAVTDAAGHYRIDDVIRGDFRVAAFDTLWPGPRVPPLSIMAEANVTEFKAYPVALRFPEPRVPPTCTSDPFGRTPTIIDVQVTRGNVRRPAHLDVRMSPLRGGEPTTASLETSGSGVAVLCGFDFGTVVIMATDKDGKSSTQTVTLWTTRVRPLTITLPR